MGYTKQLENIRQEIKNAFRSLIEEYGENNALETFEYGAMLEDSTIDKIDFVEFNDDTFELYFYYNENTKDVDSFERFTTQGLAEFYDELIEAIKEEQE